MIGLTVFDSVRSDLQEGAEIVSVTLRHMQGIWGELANHKSTGKINQRNK